jgi:predicted NAD/FAD-dependent oxidoreductase
VARWEGRIYTLNHGCVQDEQEATPRFVGVPGMNAICRHLATNLDIRLCTKVEPPSFDSHGWHLADEEGNRLGTFDCVVISAPAPQTAFLLRHVPQLQQRTSGVRMRCCWALMLSFDRSLGLAFDGAVVEDSPLSWIARNAGKPRHNQEDETRVAHASPEWSDRRLDDDAADVREALVEAFWRASGAKSRRPSYVACHLWRYAVPQQPLEDGCLYDADLQIGACGDWCRGPGVEDAFLSGMAMAGRVLGHGAKGLTHPSIVVAAE